MKNPWIRPVAQGVLLASAIMLSHGVSARPASVIIDLAELHASFEKAGNSTMGMPEYNQTLKVKGVVLDVSKNLSGRSLLQAGAASSEAALARLTPANEKEDAKLRKLAPDATFTATCTLSFASGSDYLPLSNCSFP